MPPNLYFTPLYFSAFLTILATIKVVVALFFLIVLVDEQALNTKEKTSTNSIIFFKLFVFYFLKFCFASNQAHLPLD